jgi:hypothetical protein
MTTDERGRAAGGGPVTADERRFRRLLWAYPGHYRQRHGDEIVATLLDLAADGRRPTVSQRLHLVACGLRQRFRLPAGRPLAAIAAVLTMVVLGAVGAAGGTRLGWHTASALPSDTELRGLTAAMSGVEPAGIPVDPWRTGMKGPVAGTRATGTVPYAADRIRTGLTTAGWRITTLSEQDGAVSVGPFTVPPTTTAPTRSTYFRATRGGLSLVGSSTTVTGGAAYGLAGQADLGLDVWAEDSGAVVPVTIAGLTLGMLAGWLLAAALAYRMRGSRPARRWAAAGLVTTALTAATLPAYEFYRSLYLVLIYDPGAPNPHVLYGPGEPAPGSLVLGCALTALLALAVAVLITVRAKDAEREQTATAT